jgi:hypothetical protein
MENKPPLTLVSEDRKEVINENDISNLNIDKLKDNIIKGIYVLESALFSQAQYEFNRVAKNRDLLKEIETQLFTKEILDQLPPDQKMRLYDIINKNMNTSLSFLQNLHSNVTSALEAVKSVEKEKYNTNKEDDIKTDIHLEKIKGLIKTMIISKIEKK